MDFRTHGKYLPIALISLAAAALTIAGCSGSSTTSITNPQTVTGSSFVVGTDAPMASVTSFTVPIEGLCGVTTDPTTNVSQCVPLISGTPNVDFARFNGLQTLLDMNDIQVGTYTQIQVTLGAATIGYLDMTQTPPAIETEQASYASSCSSTTSCTYTATLATPLVVTQSSAPVGLRVDFDLRKSIGVDGNGNITGTVTPTFDIGVVKNSDSGGYIDTLIASVVSVNTTGQSFVVEGPHGRQFTINVSGTTQWENGDTLSSLVAGSSIVEVSGTLDRVDATLDADDVAILSQDGFYAGGQVTYVTPATGTATSFDLYVRGLLPTSTGLTLGQIATVNLSNNPKFFIRWTHNPLTELLFNSGTMMPGQHVAVGGPASGAQSASDVTVNRVVLRDWGFNGTVVAPSTAVSAAGVNGAFQMQINGFAGVLVPQTVTVYIVPECAWRNGLTAMSDLKANENVRVVGLLLNVNGKPVLVGHYVDELN
ncbi:MAG: DUF4382 domain-containing protein [Terracidiphilus sp.]|jgi:hypothetical protein